MRAIAKSAKIHPAAKKCCGWEEPAICNNEHCYEWITSNRHRRAPGNENSTSAHHGLDRFVG